MGLNSSLDKTIRSLLDERVRPLSRVQKLEFANAIGISMRTVDALLAGERGASKKVADAIFRYFRVKDSPVLAEVEQVGPLPPNVVPFEATAVRAALRQGGLPSMISTVASDSRAIRSVGIADTVILDTTRKDFTFDPPVPCALILDGRLVFRQLAELPGHHGYFAYSDKAPLVTISARELKDIFVGKLVGVLSRP